MQRARVKPERGPPRSKRAAARKERRLDPRSDHAERQHGIGDLLEAGDVGPPDIVDEVAAVAAAMGETALMDAVHDVAEQLLELGFLPAYAGRILAHFETRHGDAAGIGGLAGRVEDLRRSEEQTSELQSLMRTSYA